MATVLGKRGKTASEAPAADAPLVDVRAALGERQTAVNALRAELGDVENQIAAIKAARLLDEPIDARALLALGERKDTLQISIADAEAIVAGLQARVDDFDRRVAARRHAELGAELAALSAAAVEHERRWEALASELVALSGEMAAAAFRHGTLAGEAGRLETRYGLASVHTRQPFQAIAIPELFFRIGSHAATFPQWLSGKIDDRPGWAGRERKRRAESPVETSTAVRAFKVLRDLVVPAAQGAHEVLPAGSVRELPADFGAWLGRDQPGAVVPADTDGAP